MKKFRNEGKKTMTENRRVGKVEEVLGFSDRSCEGRR